MTAYDKAPPVIHDRVNALIDLYYPELKAVGLAIDILVASTDSEKPPLSHGGYPALAVIRVVSLKNRVKGMADVEMTIDQSAYDAMSDKQRDALLDHELYHVIIQRDKEDQVKYDDIGRPKIKMRKHDWQLGWFKVIADRHKYDSPEVFQAQRLWAIDGATFFPNKFS